MISLSDQQLDVVMTAARGLALERRSVFLERVTAMLKLRRRFDDTDVAEVTALALHGLVQQAADSAA
jgi:hypothetical protein